MVVVFRRLHLAAYLACSASSQAAARDECRLLRTSSSSMLVFKALAASASSSSLVAQAAMLALPSCVPRAKISCRVLACSSLLDSTLEEEEEEEVEELVVVVQEEEELGVVVVVVDCIMQWSWEWRLSVASCFSSPVLHDEEEEEEEFFLDSLVGVELGTVITLLVSGEEGRELIGLPKLGVVALKGVAVRDGSTLAIGVISVPMSRVDTTTSAPPPPPPLVFTARDDDESAAAPG